MPMNYVVIYCRRVNILGDTNITISIRISLYPITIVFFSFSDPAVLASDLVDLLFRAADLAINITRVVTDDPQVDNILYIVETELSTPYLRSNITCIFEEIFNDPSVQELLGNLAVFKNFVS